VWEDGALHLCNDLRLSTVWDGEDRYHTAIEVELSAGQRRWVVHGTVLRLIPLRNRRAAPDGSELLTRICEGLTRWTLDDGRVGFGLSEYLDQIVDGVPVGLAE
jgi:hypothetical protein